MANPFDQFEAPAASSQAAPPPAVENQPSRAAPAGAPHRAAGQAGNPFDQFDPVPITDTGTTMGFADEAPKEASRQLSAEDTAQFYGMLRGDGMPKASAKELRDFIASKGLALANAEEIVRQRDSGQGVVGQINYPLPRPADPSSMTGAALRGATQGASLGFGDELHGAAAGVGALLSGGNFGDTYASTVDADRGRLAADQEQHPYAAIAGDVVGGLALPVGLERAGLTATMDAVAVEAYRTARLEGFAPDEARSIAQRAVTWRLAKESAAYGAGYGAGTAEGEPGQRLVGAGFGAAEGGLAGAALGALGERIAPRLYDARVTARGMPDAAIPDAALVAQAADRQGVQILPQDIGGPGVARATQGAAQSPFGAKVIGRAADRLYSSFQDRAGELADGAGSPMDIGAAVGARAGEVASRSTAAADRISGAILGALPEATDSTGAGQLIQRGVSRFMDDTAERASALYREVPIAADQPAQLSNTRRLLNDLTAEWESNPQLGAIFRSGRLANYLDALTPNVTKADTGLLNAAGKPITRDVTEGGGLNWQDLQEFRTRIGDMLANPRLDEKIAPRQLSALYGALSSDMEATAREAGPEAFAKWKRANNFYDGRMKRINDTFSMVLGDRKDRTPNEAYAALQAMLKPGSTGNAAAFGRIMRSLPPEDANIVRASIVNDARSGRQFDPVNLAKVWGGLSERGKSALLPQPGMRALIDDAAGRATLASKNPFAGLSGEQVFARLETMAGSKGDAARFRQTVAGLSPEEANAVRATFIDRLGRAAPGQQNAEGDAFSIARWLTKWNTMTPEARTALFGNGELRAAMNDLATVAERVKASERLAGHSNTGAISEYNKTNASLWAAAVSLFTGHPLVAFGLASPAAYQRISAEILTSPRLVRWLARVPKKADRAAQLDYLSKLSAIAVREPALADNIVDLRAFLRRAIDQSPRSVAARDNVDERRQVPPQQQHQPETVH